MYTCVCECVFTSNAATPATMSQSRAAATAVRRPESGFWAEFVRNL